MIAYHGMPSLKKDNIDLTVEGSNNTSRKPKNISQMPQKRNLQELEPSRKKNLVQFMDSKGRVIATLRNPLSWNSANVTLSKSDDHRRYVSELHELHNSGVLKRDTTPQWLTTLGMLL